MPGSEWLVLVLSCACQDLVTDIASPCQSENWWDSPVQSWIKVKCFAASQRELLMQHTFQVIFQTGQYNLTRVLCKNFLTKLKPSMYCVFLLMQFSAQECYYTVLHTSTFTRNRLMIMSNHQMSHHRRGWPGSMWLIKLLGRPIAWEWINSRVAGPGLTGCEISRLHGRLDTDQLFWLILWFGHSSINC